MSACLSLWMVSVVQALVSTKLADGTPANLLNFTFGHQVRPHTLSAPHTHCLLHNTRCLLYTRTAQTYWQWPPGPATLLHATLCTIDFTQGVHRIKVRPLHATQIVHHRLHTSCALTTKSGHTPFLLLVQTPREPLWSQGSTRHTHSRL